MGNALSKCLEVDGLLGWHTAHLQARVVLQECVIVIALTHGMLTPF